MKKRSPVLVVLVILMLMALGVGPALAAGVAPPYDPWCYASNNYYVEDSGPDHAYVTGEAEARADGWELGSRVSTHIDNSTEFSGSLYADASFSQQFEVTAAGLASINFAYDGWLEAINYGVGTIDGMYGLSFDFSADDDYGNSDGDSAYLEGDGYDPYGGTFSFNYTFTGDDVGDIFTVYLDLQTGLDAEYIGYTGAGSADFTADFYNTAEIVDVTGGLAPVSNVPIPGALWLLGSGLFGLVAVRRKKES